MAARLTIEDPLLTTEEFAAFVRIHPKHAAKMRRNGTGPAFVVRVSAVRTDQTSMSNKAYRRPSWWVAILVVVGFATLQVARIVSNTASVATAGSSMEARWIDAAYRQNRFEIEARERRN